MLEILEEVLLPDIHFWFLYKLMDTIFIVNSIQKPKENFHFIHFIETFSLRLSFILRFHTFYSTFPHASHILLFPHVLFLQNVPIFDGIIVMRCEELHEITQ